MKRPQSEPRTLPTGQRGPIDNQRRERIIATADEQFRRYGYDKTTVADLAKAIGLSTAYIYKFFDSKHAIAEAVCASCLGRIDVELRSIAREPKPASDRLRRTYLSLAQQSSQLFLDEPKLHDIVTAACGERWQAVKDHQAALLEIVREVVAAGREAGEFEQETPIDEACRAILQTMQPFSHPVLLEQNLDDLYDNTAMVASLVLRSLAR